MENKDRTGMREKKAGDRRERTESQGRMGSRGRMDSQETTDRQQVIHGKDAGEEFDTLLHAALSGREEPPVALNREIINHWEEKEIMKKSGFRKLRTAVALAACIVLGTTATVFAAVQLLNPKQVAEELSDGKLAEAFEGGEGILINETQIDGGYKVTLLGMANGENLSDFTGSAELEHPERSYAVVAIEREDGTPMPAATSDAYMDLSFFMSPLVKGLAPWQFNIASMGGSYSEMERDGVLYRVIECDGVEKFADRGLYLVVSDEAFFNKELFPYDEATGAITAAGDYEGLNVIFNLPIDPAKADPEAAQEYIDSMQ